MTASRNALAIFDLVVAYNGDMTAEEAQRRLHLTDQEMREAAEILRRAFLEVESRDYASL